MKNWNTSIYVFSFKFNFKLTTGVAVKLGPLNPTIHHLFHLKEKRSLRNRMGNNNKRVNKWRKEKAIHVY